MGFMNQFNRQPQGSSVASLLSAAQQAAGNDPRAFLQTLADNGATVNLPNGKSMAVGDLMQMAEGKSAQQFLAQLGL